MQIIIIHAENLGRIGVGAGLPTVFLILLYIPLSLYLHFPLSLSSCLPPSPSISQSSSPSLSPFLLQQRKIIQKGEAHRTIRLAFSILHKKPPFTERKRKYFFTRKRHVRTTNKPKSVPNIRHFPDTPKFSLFTTFKVLCEVPNT
jgi:hypothetical protein